jgi:hypothetical protein
MDHSIAWTEGFSTWNMKNSQFVKHVQWEEVKLLIVYHRLYDDMYSIDEVQTLDGQNIIDMLRDRVIQALEKMI